MYSRTKHSGASLFLALMMLFLSACSNSSTSTAAAEISRPDWFDFSLTDARTGETFAINDYAGKVVLLETMAMWCPNCTVQAHEVRQLHELLGHPDDLVSVSLDVDVNEDQASLKEYAEEFGFEWHFAIAPRDVARALGNLYTAQYLNPPLSPMMIIDRDGNVHHLEYGLKEAETLQEKVEPYLNP